MKQTLKQLALAMFVAGTVAVLRAPLTHAATISVAAGTDATNVNSICTLSEAITNINAGDTTAYPECSGSGAFGDSDTITLPVGTITLSADLPEITRSVVIEGQNMTSSKVDGNSLWRPFRSNNSSIGTLVFRKMKIQAFKEAAINTNSGGPDDTANLVVSDVEIDGTSAIESNQVLVGVQMLTVGTGAHSLTANNVYIHDFSGAAQGTVAGIMAGSSNNTIDVNISNTTVSNLENTLATAQGINIITGAYSSFAPAAVNAAITNVTIDSIVSRADAVGGIGILGLVSGGNTDISVNATALTVRGIRGLSNVTFPVDSGAFFIGALAGTPTDVSNVELTFTNSLLVDNMNNNSLNNCSNRNLNPSFGGSGTVNTIISSGGGNLTDDSSCSTYFTQTSDKTNLGTLNSSLGALSNNGGFVPTIPLLANSPAIDSGVTVAGMTQDARLAARPQGEAFDSGAYESPFSRPATTTLAVTGTDSLVLMIASIGLISTGASYLLLKLRQSRI